MMTYAVMEAAGKQYKVYANEKIKLDLNRDFRVGEKLIFNNILLIGGDIVKIGTPLIPNASINATVLSVGKDKKIIVFKKKRRQGYQKTQGHRQHHVEVLINEVNCGS